MNADSDSAAEKEMLIFRRKLKHFSYAVVASYAPDTTYNGKSIEQINMFASDATIRVLNAGMPHPRGYYANARALGRYIRDEKVISLEEAIR